MAYYSFVMVCYNNWSFTDKAVKSFFEYLNPIHQNKGIELIIVNNGSNDETEAGIEECRIKFKEVSEIKTVHLEKNLGYIVGVNIGLSNCSGEIITLLNNDLVFCPGWFDSLANIFDADLTVGAATPLLTNGSGEENIELEYKKPEMKEAFFKSKETMNYYAAKIMEKNSKVIIKSNRIVGTCIAFRKDILLLVGGLDFWFGIGIFDDDDFSIRINLAGYKTVIVGGSFVYHIGSATFSKFTQMNDAAVISNKKKFLRKWKIKCTENVEGFYDSREDVLLRTHYIRKKHFIPFEFSQFKKPSEKSLAKKTDVKRMLLVADWNNFKSGWLKELERNLLQTDIKKEINLWIPAEYFTKTEVENEVSKIIGTDSNVNYIEKDINSEDLLEFLSSFDAVIPVTDDFVNRYIIYLAKQMNIEVLRL
ncbi:glycosyltransferase [Lachnoclostridium sp.]|uniref:glycosyltransferase family 2 protein n=1 Tax=Lachnoclostridium sp. TaxID=2028282 RepID=UPI00289D3608|nr:glycosyltransferase [Lachnoclostridium sp.]